VDVSVRRLREDSVQDMGSGGIQPDSSPVQDEFESKTVATSL
jgi:hypothetical protein